jgi:hypothetical protein
MSPPPPNARQPWALIVVAPINSELYLVQYRCMPAHILAARPYIPPLPPGQVLRPHLVERLKGSHCAGCKLNLISAPAGFRKTTLVAQWIAGAGQPAAWLSLDEAGLYADGFSGATFPAGAELG